MSETKVISFEPSPPQLRFLQAKQKYVCYGGARGGGKSFIIQRKADMLANRWPGIKILIVRRTFRELESNHIAPMIKLIGNRAKYNRQKKMFEYPNGSTIEMEYCAADGHVQHFQGRQFDVIMIDESTALKEEWIKDIIVCMRGTEIPIKRCYLCCNPGGVSHGYHKRLFVDRKFLKSEDPNDHVFIPAKVQDNKALREAQPDYVKQLDNLPPKLRAAWRDGSWDIFSGAVYEEWRNDPEHYKDRQWTHVISAKGFKVPKWWDVYRSFDWGFRRPFACTYYTIDPDGVVYMIAEFYGCQRDTFTGETLPNEGLKWEPEYLFQQMRSFEQNHPLLMGREITGVADPAIWSKEMGPSVVEHAINAGIYFQKANNDRFQGLMQLHYRLQFDAEGYPRMYVLDTCPETARTIPLLQYDEHKVEDVDTDGEDHIFDTIKYFLNNHLVKPMEAKPDPLRLTDPLDMFTSY